jgi:hypothetical protein
MIIYVFKNMNIFLNHENRWIFKIKWEKLSELAPEFLTSWSRSRTKMDQLRNTDQNRYRQLRIINEDLWVLQFSKCLSWNQSPVPVLLSPGRLQSSWTICIITRCRSDSWPATLIFSNSVLEGSSRNRTLKNDCRYRHLQGHTGTRFPLYETTVLFIQYVELYSLSVDLYLLYGDLLNTQGSILGGADFSKKFKFRKAVWWFWFAKEF